MPQQQRPRRALVLVLRPATTCIRRRARLRLRPAARQQHRDSDEQRLALDLDMANIIAIDPVLPRAHEAGNSLSASFIGPYVAACVSALERWNTPMFARALASTFVVRGLRSRSYCVSEASDTPCA